MPSARHRIPTLWLRLACLGLLAGVLLAILPGCTQEIVRPSPGGALKVGLQAGAEAVDHGWLVVDEDQAGRMRMTRVDNYLESPPFEIDPGRHLFAITALDKAERPLFFGQVSDSVSPGAAFLSLEIVLRPVKAVCSVTPGDLDFGTVALGSALVDSVTVANADTALGYLALDLPATCGPFRLVTGSGVHLLEPGQELVITIAFEPASAGLQDCALDVGPDCGVALVGQGQALPVCTIAPAGRALDFGTVPVDEVARLSFTVSNTGDGTLEGQIGAASGTGFAVTQGAGAFSLAGGQSRNVEVEFAPRTPGAHVGTVTTGTACGDVTLAGRGEALPVCAITPANQALDFGTVPVAETARISFTVSNTGGGVLEGQIGAATGTGFAVTQGAGAFSLAAGQSRNVEIEFAPEAAGAHAGAVATGTPCGEVAVTGLGEALPVCAISPESQALDFGTVPVGQTVGLAFTVSNAGGGMLEGQIGAATGAAFVVTQGAGAFSLAAGQSRNVEIEFAPEAAGAHAGAVATGTPCGQVTLIGRGEALPACAITPETQALDFGSVPVGQTAGLAFTVSNTGGGVLEGQIGAASGTGFAIVQGAGAFSLAAGQSWTVEVEFVPQTEGDFAGAVATGTPCGQVTLTGQGEALPVCAITPESRALDFGTVQVGTSADLEFAITNTGGGLLTGTVAEGLSYCTLLAGGGNYELAAGQTREVIVRFSPPTPGLYDFQVATGAACGAVQCTGTGEALPLPVITPTFLNFGLVTVGETAQDGFTITNGGGGILIGAVYESCEGFAVADGGGPFALAAGQSLPVTVAFAPTSADTFVCFLQTGTKGNHVVCAGAGVDPPLCQIDPQDQVLDFGPVTVGQSATLSLTITNTGGGLLAGDVGSQGQGFSIRTGGGPYVLAAGEMREVVVEFAPEAAGPAHGVLSVGAGCGDVVCTGEGTAPPPLSPLEPSSLDFGQVLVGSTKSLSFTINNLSAVARSGEVKENCRQYRVTDGGGDFTLAPGQSRLVTVEFAPDRAGVLDCAIWISEDKCDDYLTLPVTGEGIPTTGF